MRLIYLLLKLRRDEVRTKKGEDMREDKRRGDKRRGETTRGDK